MFDYDRQGRYIAMADGDELLVQDGPSEGPLWRTQEATPIVGVAIAQNSILSLDTAGRLAWRDAVTGSLKGELQVGAGARALAVDEQGRAAIALPDAVVIVSGQAIERRLAVEDATVLAWGEGGGLGVGTGGGRALHFGKDDAPAYEAELPRGATAITWNAHDFWLVGAGEELYRFKADGLTRVTSGPGDITSLSCSPDGYRVALLIAERIVLVLVLPSRDTLTTVQYIDRKATGVRIGPGNWLGIGMDQGDGNKIDMVTGATHRTDTHPGREHHSWMLKVATDPSVEGDAPAAEAGPPAKKGNPAVAIGFFAVLAAVLYFLFK
ncbi:MAG: hypothetical protein H6706_16015 [Myxococcales bacterium]|nr:hypothetical protein [Myxococcales bacterium]